MAFKRFKFTGLLVVLLLIAFVGGCGLSGSKDKKNIGGQTEKPKTEERTEKPNTGAPKREDNNAPPVNPQPTKEEVELTLYFGDDQAMYLKPEKRTVPKEGKPMADLLVEGLIEGPRSTKLTKTIPDGTKLLSLQVVDGVAFVNFSREMMTNHWGGTTGETLTSQSVIITLTQLPEIKKVQFLIEGKKEESIWGHGYTGEPLLPGKDIVAK